MFFSREDMEKCLEPGKLVFQDRKVVFVRHGNFFVFGSSNRLCRISPEYDMNSGEVIHKKM